MPRKNDLLKKQKRLIATRLMQISLLVDDYLYQHKPMSEKSAVAYMKEISGYKDSCYQDVRSLQVIEKLTRCMKGIIQEQQELSGECYEDVFVPPSQHTSEATNVMISPVYSTVDEDLTQCDIDEDVREIRENGKNNNNYVEINDSNNDVTNETDHLGGTNMEIVTNAADIVPENSNDTTQTEKFPQNTDLVVIDLCDDEIEELINQNNIIEPDLIIQKAISRLSIRDIEETLTPFSQDCSQSILNSYYTTDLQKDKEDPLTLDCEDVITATIHQKPATETKNDKITKIVLPKKIPATKQNIHMLREIIAIPNNIADVPGKMDSARALKPVSKKRNAKNNDSNSKAVKARTVQNKPLETVKKQAQRKTEQKVKYAKQLKPQAVQSYTQKPSQFDQYERNNKIPLTHSKLLVTKPTDNTKTQRKSQDLSDNQKKSQELPIYNRKVANDLSWIENIRFVREISSEEYESFTENEIFWENYTLPSHWNENDFNY